MGAATWDPPGPLSRGHPMMNLCFSGLPVPERALRRRRSPRSWRARLDGETCSERPRGRYPMGSSEGSWEKGELVPDDVVCGVVRERLAKPTAKRVHPGWVPKTVPPALALEKDLAADAETRALRRLPDFEPGQLVRRLTAR